MAVWTSGRIAELLDGRLIGDDLLTVQGCRLDSREIREQEIFVALPGERVDGYDYILSAWSNGASLAIAAVDRFVEAPLTVPEGKALILVGNPLEALQELAALRRQSLEVRVVGVTGSNGKTTTKDMIAAVLAGRFRVYKNQGNHNNELGLPLTIMNAPEDAEILVLEMGMRGINEIKALCTIARPDLAVITNIGTTHLELLESQENIAKAKWEIVEALPSQGVAVLNAEDEWSAHMSRGDRHVQHFYGLDGKFHQLDIQGVDLQVRGALETVFTVRNLMEDQSRAPVRVCLPLPGEHHVLDALAALTVGIACGVPLQEGAAGLAEMKLTRMRLEMKDGLNDSILLSDVYNANPVSMKASLQVLKERATGQFTMAVLGEMYELGPASVSGHQEVGRTAAEIGLTMLIAVGPLAEEIAWGALEAGMPREQVYYFADKQQACRQARTELMRQKGAWVLIKASRGMKMEEVTAELQSS